MRFNYSFQAAIWAFGLLLVLTSSSGFAFAQAPAAGAGQPLPVVVAHSRVQDLAETSLVTGTAEANAYVEIRPEVAGRVTEILLIEGARAALGMPLLRLDARAAEARRDQAKAELANAEQQLRRASALREGTAVTAARVDELQAAVEGARARLREAEVLVDQHTIKMPFEGTVGLRRISVGAQVTTATIVTTADDSSTINIVFRIPDIWLATVTPGLTVSVIPAIASDDKLTGSVVAIDSRVDSTSRTIGVKAQVDNSAGVVKPGSLVKVELPLARKANAVVVPEQALLTIGEQQVLFVAEQGKARRMAVTLGLRQRGIAEVVEGLTAGQAVIAAGADRLRDGAAINAAEILPGWEPPPVAVPAP
jgi:membrane fusion protein (multidrug efflux system)